MRHEVEHEQTIPELVRGALNDARDLVREEIALAKAELREEIAKARTATISFVAAALLGVLAMIAGVAALARGLAVAFGWDPWAGYATVFGVLLIVAAGIAYFGYSVIAGDRHMPNTVDTLKENATWMRGPRS